MKSAGLVDVSWEELGKIFNCELRGDEPGWSESAYRKKYQYAKRLYQDVFSKIDAPDYAYDLDIKKRELEKLKKQIQTEKIEYNKWLREEARDELIFEKIIDEIGKLSPIEFPAEISATEEDLNSKSGVLAFGDAHYGAEFKIHGLHGDLINEYSPAIFQQRMTMLLRETVKIARREGLQQIYVFDLGDVIDGVLRVKQLWKLKYGVVESTVRYANLMCAWLNELSRYVKVKFRMTDGNHSELRMLGQPKGTFSEDNMGRVVYYIIATRLANNPNFEIDQNQSGWIFENIRGLNILACHGQVKKLDEAIKDFSNVYKTNIDLLVAAHLHHSETETVGVCRDVVRIPSLMGLTIFQ